MRGAGAYLTVWLICLALLGLSIFIALIPALGAARLWAGLAIAGVKAGLIGWVYMDLRKADGIVRIAALLALLFLSVLVGLTVLDFAWRAGPSA